MTAQFIQQWDEDKGNFIIDPPNATVSVLGGVGSDVSDAVVTLMSPVLEGSTLTFQVKVLEGALVGPGPAGPVHRPRRLRWRGARRFPRWG